MKTIKSRAATLALILILLLATSMLTSSCDSTKEAVFVNSQLVDDNGVPYGVPTAGGLPQVLSQDYLLSIAENTIAGHEMWTLRGNNQNVGTTYEAVWDYSTAYVLPAAPIQMEVVSTDNTKDISGGAGVTSVLLTYLDGSFVEHRETILLSGTTPVGTAAKDIYRVNYFCAQTTGSDGVSAGNISLRTFGGGTIYGYMLAGRNIAEQAIYTVPAGKTLYITSRLYSTSDAAKGVRLLHAAKYNQVARTALSFFMAQSEIVSFNSVVYIPLEIPTRIPEKIDMAVACISTQAGASASTQLRGWLENN